MYLDDRRGYATKYRVEFNDPPIAKNARPLKR